MSKRNEWSSKFGFIFAAVGSAVGLGNIWRYPYIVYANGGGAFLIPYFVAIFTAGIPILILEYSLGHRFKGSAPLSFYRANKKFEWLGWFPSMIAGCIILYYGAIISWALNYAVLSITKAWGSDTSAYFFGTFLGTTGSPFEFGSLRIPVLIGLIIVWLSVWLICYKQIKGIEKINKILLPVLFVMILVIIAQGLMLPGAVDGLNQLFTPQWDRIFDHKIWIAAYGQVFFSLSIAMAIMITYSSYLPDKTDLSNSAFIAAFANSAFEFLCAIGVFSILGFMANNQGVPVSEVVSSGIGLSFIVFPQGINQMQPIVGTIIGIGFFCSLVFAGITSLISLCEAFAAPFIDKFGVKRERFFTYLCIVGGGISLIFASGAGILILDIVDFFINSYGIVVVGLLEAITIGWIYGAERIREHANSVSHYRIGKWWDIAIKFVVPAILSITLIQSVRDLILNGYEGYERMALFVFGVLVIATNCIISVILTKRPWHFNSKEESSEVTK